MLLLKFPPRINMVVTARGFDCRVHIYLNINLNADFYDQINIRY